MTKDPIIVSVVRLDSYEPKEVRKALDRLLAPFGSMKAFVDGKQNALIKPNFLMPSPIEKALTTHPEIIRAAAEALVEAGVPEVLVTDSPGIGSAQKCAKKLLLEVDSKYFKVRDSVDAVECDSVEGDFRKIRFSKCIMEADAVINIPKLKTHAQMGMTLAVKNTFGAVMGADKAQWHFRSGRDPMEFARLIVRIHERVAPVLNILDGVIGMEGNGPSSGDPRSAGFLAASPNAHALDSVVCKILGIDPENVCTLTAAKRMGLVPSETNIEIVNDSVEMFRPSTPWKLARPMKTRLVGPSWSTPLLDRLLSVSPLIDKQKCTLCLRCVECCAAEAVAKKSGGLGAEKSTGRMVIDEKKCIACFCCQEMCPEGAIRVKTSVWARLLRIGIR